MREGFTISQYLCVVSGETREKSSYCFKRNYKNTGINWALDYCAPKQREVVNDGRREPTTWRKKGKKKREWSKENEVFDVSWWRNMTVRGKDERCLKRKRDEVYPKPLHTFVKGHHPISIDFKQGSHVVARKKIPTQLLACDATLRSSKCSILHSEGRYY